VLTVGALVHTALAWKNRCWGIAARVYYTLVTVAAVAFVWFLNYWNLLGWRYSLANDSWLARQSSSPRQPMIRKTDAIF
jgi:hypothetical protein